MPTGTQSFPLGRQDYAAGSAQSRHAPTTAANNDKSLLVGYIKALVSEYITAEVPSALNNRSGYVAFEVETDVGAHCTWFCLRYYRHPNYGSQLKPKELLWERKEHDYMRLLQQSVMAELALVSASSSVTNSDS